MSDLRNINSNEVYYFYYQNVDWFKGTVHSKCLQTEIVLFKKEGKLKTSKVSK